MEVITSPEAERQLIRLMEQYEKDLLRMCSVYLRDRALAEDAVQETFWKAYQGLGRFRGEAAEKTWLMRIAINTCKDMQRSAWFRMAERRVPLDELPLPAPTADESSVALTQEIMRLPRREKEVVLLYYYQGLKEKEIAQALGVSGAAVSKRLKQARAHLHRAMRGGDEDA